MFHLEFNYHHNGRRKGKQWTENFYCDTLVLNTAIDRAKAMAALLSPLHGAQSALIDCRIHNLEPGKQRKGTLVPFDADTSVSSADSTDSDYPTTALSILLQSADGTTTRQWLKGLPDNIVKKGEKVPEATWDPKFTTLKSYLKTATNLIRMRVQTANPDAWRIDGFSDAAVLTLPPNDLVDGETVLITGRKLPKSFRGEKLLVKQDDTHFKLYGVKPVAGFEFSGTGLVRRVAFDSLTISDVTIVEATSHKVHKEKK